MSVRNLPLKGKGLVILSTFLHSQLKIKPSLGLCSRPSQNSACILWCVLTNKELQRAGQETILKANSFINAPRRLGFLLQQLSLLPGLILPFTPQDL